jgi:hypothetical protein
VPRPPQGALDLEERQAAGGCAARLVGPRQERLLVTPLSRFAQGRDIPLSEGILFTTYATLRSEERGAKKSRVDQIVDWLGRLRRGDPLR